jgi:hypothetical protein
MKTSGVAGVWARIITSRRENKRQGGGRRPVVPGKPADATNAPAVIAPHGRGTAIQLFSAVLHGYVDCRRLRLIQRKYSVV